MNGLIWGQWSWFIFKGYGSIKCGGVRSCQKHIEKIKTYRNQSTMKYTLKIDFRLNSNRTMRKKLYEHWTRPSILA